LTDNKLSAAFVFLLLLLTKCALKSEVYC